ncbi:MAG: VWA domain-containing protein, partial [candidate division Zixibacteria bacterium]|nr:VWA domain-containing protein [candidate division Zixibacteria bacterium]
MGGDMQKIIRPFLLLLFVLAIFTVAYADDLWGPPEDPFDPNWIPDGGGQKNTKSSDTALTISQLIHSEFPTITTYVDVVDENGDPIPGLTESDFCVYQDGQPVGSFTVDSILGDSCYTSVCLVMDISGSMCTGFPNNSLEGAKIAAHEFVNNMDPFDRVSIVTFSNCVSTLIDFTSDQDSLHDAIDGLYCQGWTAAFDGIWMGVDNAATELGSKAVIAFTDGMENRSQYCWPPPDGLAWDSDYSDDSTIICDKANAAGAPIFTIGLGVADSIAEPLEAFAEGTGGFYTFAPTANEMEFVYTTIKERICKRYIITYTSPDMIQDGDLHEVVICMNTDGTCDFGTDSFCDTSYYQETAPPEISQTPATMELQDTCQPVATAITICADVNDLADPPVQSVQLFYRKEGTASYTSVEMTGSPYCADVPASVVGAGPGIEYYIVASDGEQTVSDPPFSQNPQNNPYNIEICANLPPLCSVPDDTTIVQCTIAEVCLPVSCSDPDGNLVSGPTIMSGPGSIVGGNWCYTPSGDEVAVVTIRCTDIVDEFCEATFQVTFDVNEAPVCSAPADTSIFLCESQEVCLPVSASDPDGNLDGCVITSGPGTLSGGNWCYTPTADEAVSVTVKCTDDCGEFCEETFTVQFDINEAPVCSLPEDTSIFMCEAAEICLPASATDADGNLTGCEVTSGPGSIVGGNWCYTPTADGSYTVVIKCTDDCGAFCEGSFNISI